MFVFIQADLVNVNHIVSCTPGNDVTVIVLDNGRRIMAPTESFETNVLPLLPMLKAPEKDLTILPPEEVQVKPEAPVEPPKATRSRSRKNT